MSRAAWLSYVPRLDGLAPRVAAYLGIALLPLGLIALWQTREFTQETRTSAELTLLALTEQGATEVERAVAQALGAGAALEVVADLFDDPETCARHLRRFVEERRLFSFVGLLPPDGRVTCSSLGRPFDIEDRAELAELLAAPRVVVEARDGGPGREDDMLVVGIPLSPGGQAAGASGYLAISIARSGLVPASNTPATLQPQLLVTFTPAGKVLTRGGLASERMLSDFLPAGYNLAQEAQAAPRAYPGRSESGREHFYTVTPLIPDVLYAMGIWTPEQAGQGTTPILENPLLFPLLMWITSLVVAFWAIHRLVIRRIRRLVARMRRFGQDRDLPERSPKPGTPMELTEIEDAFRTMATSVLQDEARMENAFRERGVLLREVHHRVKNNLQLISSIISMQVRRMPEPRVRAILRRLQDRVLTLASIYRSLYTSPDLGDVNAAPVLRAIVEQELKAAEGRVEVTLDFEDMVLDPDKVVPLAFLAAEAVSNALAYSGAGDVRPTLSVTLQRDGDQATLRIINSVGTGPPVEAAGLGLGQHLIHAFAAQVGGPVGIETRDGLYVFSVTFPAVLHEAAPAEG